jgi:hypothetical protein
LLDHFAESLAGHGAGMQANPARNSDPNPEPEGFDKKNEVV